jgi:5'-nucleotidase
MNFLLTNDDGVEAPGLSALAKAFRAFGNVTILAPDRNWSGSGHVKTLNRPLRVKKVVLRDGSEALACDGAPSDCVAVALLGLIEESIDYVISGINPYPNLGHDLTYSGTVTAAMEAVIAGVPGIAVSLDGPHDTSSEVDYSTAAMIATRVFENFHAHPTPAYTLLNVNIPYLPENELKGFRITRQGLRIYRDKLVARKDPFGTPYYWIGGEAPIGVPEDGTDIGALADGYVSVTPVQMDMTAHQLIPYLQSWTW